MTISLAIGREQGRLRAPSELGSVRRGRVRCLGMSTEGQSHSGGALRGGAGSGGDSKRFVTSAALVAVLALCSVTLLTSSLPAYAQAVVQVISAVAGAWLGSIIQTGSLSASIRQQARSSIRHLLDHAELLGALATSIRDPGLTTTPKELEVWCDGLHAQVRAALASTQTAVANWDDVAPGLQDEEMQRYFARQTGGRGEEKR